MSRRHRAVMMPAQAHGEGLEQSHHLAKTTLPLSHARCRNWPVFGDRASHYAHARGTNTTLKNGQFQGGKCAILGNNTLQNASMGPTSRQQIQSRRQRARRPPGGSHAHLNGYPLSTAK